MSPKSNQTAPFTSLVYYHGDKGHPTMDLLSTEPNGSDWQITCMHEQTLVCSLLRVFKSVKFLIFFFFIFSYFTLQHNYILSENIVLFTPYMYLITLFTSDFADCSCNRTNVVHFYINLPTACSLFIHVNVLPENYF